MITAATGVTRMSSRTRGFSLAIIVATCAGLLPACTTPPPAPDGLADLDGVIRQVEHALDAYQAGLGDHADPLPPLQSADFAFKVTLSRTAGAKASLLVFKLGASRESDVTSDVSFHYEPGKRRLPADAPAAPALHDELLDTLEAAARVVGKAGSVRDAAFSKLTVALQFGVRQDGSLVASPSGGSGSVGLSGAVGRNDIQSVRLVFGN